MNYRLSINLNFLKSCSFSKNRNEKILRIAILLVNNIVKHVKGYQISTDFNSCKVYVKDFPRANFQCKQDYVLNLLYVKIVVIFTRERKMWHQSVVLKKLLTQSLNYQNHQKVTNAKKLQNV